MDTGALFELVRNNLDVVIAITSAIVALISALVARGETRRQRKLQTERLRQGIDASSLDWGGAAIDSLARIAAFVRTRHMQPNDLSFEAARANMLITLSTLVDRGRLFFPNVAPDKSGAGKESAYQGQRPPILDAMMFTYHELAAVTREGGPPAEDSAAFIDECRRLLVSELQAHLDPRRLDEIVGRYDQQTHENRKTAIERAKTLRRSLLTRRPDITLERSPSSHAPQERPS